MNHNYEYLPNISGSMFIAILYFHSSVVFGVIGSVAIIILDV